MEFTKEEVQFLIDAMKNIPITGSLVGVCRAVDMYRELNQKFEDYLKNLELIPVE